MRTELLAAVKALARVLFKGTLAGARLTGAAVVLAAPAALPVSALAATPQASLNIGISVVGIGGVSTLAAAPGAAVGEINLVWTEPVRSGTTGPHFYDMRVSTVANIATNAQFLAAQPLSAFSSSPLPAPGPGLGQAALVVTGLQPGVLHYFALREIDSLAAAGTWLRSVAQGWNVNNSAQAASIPPAPVTDLTGLAGPGEGQVALSWTAPEPPVLLSYRIFHATFSVADVGGSTSAWRAAAFSSSTVVAAAAAPHAVETAVLALSPGVRYYFGVETTNTSGLGPLDLLSSGAQAQVRAKGVAPVLDLAAASGPTSTGVNLTWTEPFVSSTTVPLLYQVKISSLGFINGATDFAAAQPVNAIASATVPGYGGGGGSVNMEVTGLVPFTTYYFAVRLVDASTPTLAGVWLRAPLQGRNTNTGALPFFIPQPPDPVTDLTALPGTAEGDVDLVWTAPRNQNLANVVSYEVRFATFSAVSAGSTTTWHAAASSAAFGAALPPGSVEVRTVGGLLPTSTWYFSVKAIDVTGQIAPIDLKSSTTLQAAALPRSLPPSQPGGLTALAGMRAAALTWTDLSPAGKGLDFAHYRLERSTDALSYISVTTTTGVAFTEAPLTALVTYYYRLIARDLRGNESVASSTASVVPFTLRPMEPIGVTVAATSTTVTLNWAPTTRFGDGTLFLSTAAPSADELIGYAIHRSTNQCAPDFVNISSIPAGVTTHVSTTGGQAYYYRLFSYNSLGVSTNTLTVSSLGERGFFVEDCGTFLTMDAQSSLTLNQATNGLGGDVRISARRRPEDVGGAVFQSVEWRALLNGVQELPAFTLPKPARIVVRFNTQNGVVVPDTAPASGFASLAGGAAPANVAPKNVGLYWYNGGEFRKMFGAVSTVDNTVTIQTPNLGLYQVRALFRADGAVFDLSNVSNRVITPNGDGLNDHVIFTYDPGPANAAVGGRVYDVQGAFVADMRPGLVPNTLTWDGRRNGAPVSGGIYVYKIEGDGKTYTGTVVVAR